LAALVDLALMCHVLDAWSFAAFGDVLPGRLKGGCEHWAQAHHVSHQMPSWSGYQRNQLANEI
jgi:hypothetical protein